MSTRLWRPGRARKSRSAPPTQPGGTRMAPSQNRNYTANEVLNSIQKEKVKWLDLQFTDLLGALQHISVPSTSVDADSFKHGIGKLDGSSIKGFKEIHESDMVLFPDANTYAVLPWGGGLNGNDFSNGNGHENRKIARLIVDVHEGGTHERF